MYRIEKKGLMNSKYDISNYVFLHFTFHFFFINQSINKYKNILYRQKGNIIICTHFFLHDSLHISFQFLTFKFRSDYVVYSMYVYYTRSHMQVNVQYFINTLQFEIYYELHSLQFEICYELHSLQIEINILLTSQSTI